MLPAAVGRSAVDLSPRRSNLSELRIGLCERRLTQLTAVPCCATHCLRRRSRLVSAHLEHRGRENGAGKDRRVTLWERLDPADDRHDR